MSPHDRSGRQRGYHGPHVVLTPAEVVEIRHAIDGRAGDVAEQIRAKCDAAIKRRGALTR